jgi:hypothetical protein
MSSSRASQSGRSSTNAIERLHEEFKRRIKTLTVLPSADTAAMQFWALLASGQINMRQVDGWQTPATTTIDQPIDLAARNDNFISLEICATTNANIKRDGTES